MVSRMFVGRGRSASREQPVVLCLRCLQHAPRWWPRGTLSAQSPPDGLGTHGAQTINRDQMANFRDTMRLQWWPSLRCKRACVPALSKWVAHGCLSPRRRASGIAAISREGTSRRVPQYCSALRLHHATAAAAAAAAAATGSRASATSCRQERQEEWRRGRRRGTRRSAQRHCCGQEAEEGHDSRHQRA
jgi:hypothetical protein